MRRTSARFLTFRSAHTLGMLAVLNLQKRAELHPPSEDEEIFYTIFPQPCAVTLAANGGLVSGYYGHMCKKLKLYFSIL
jgi:hypothetical protein